MSIADTRDFEANGQSNSNASAIGLPKFNFIELSTLIAFTLCIIIQAILVFLQEINWDEFYFLSLIYEYQRGELSIALQTFHVHFFGWLTATGGNEIQQIEIARSIMLAFEIGIMICIYQVARVFVPRQSALISVLAYISSGFVISYGTSFRADPIAAFLVMTSLVILARSKLRISDLVLTSFLISLAGLITVKIIFYAPALAGMGLWRVFRAQNAFEILVKLSGCACGAIIIFGISYWLHQYSLPAADLAGSAAMMNSAAQTTLLNVEFFPRMDDVKRGISLALVPAFLILLGLCVAIIGIAANKNKRFEMVVVIALATPLLSFLFYRNAYPYYFAYILPPAMVLVGVGAHHIKLSARIWVILIMIMVLTSIFSFAQMLKRDQDAQTEVVKIVHQMFSSPVAVIDRNSMIASYPKRGFFMSTWGLKNYHLRGIPVFKNILQSETVPLLILNSPSLEEAVGAKLTGRLRAKLLPEDKIILSHNYIPHWGKIWIAGQIHKVDNLAIKTVISIPGEYQIETHSPILINEKEVTNGQLIYLERGEHILLSKAPQWVTLRWGKNLYRPTFDPIEKPIYLGF